MDFFNKLRYKISMFMVQRNGVDDLNRFIFIFCLVFCLLSIFTKSRICNIIYYFLICLFLFRALSKNLPARRKENDKFTGAVKYLKAKWTYRKEYVMYRCECGQTVRIPRHHGTVEASCPNCRRTRKVNTGSKK